MTFISLFLVLDNLESCWSLEVALTPGFLKFKLHTSRKTVHHPTTRSLTYETTQRA